MSEMNIEDIDKLLNLIENGELRTELYEKFLIFTLDEGEKNMLVNNIHNINVIYKHVRDTGRMNLVKYLMMKDKKRDFMKDFLRYFVENNDRLMMRKILEAKLVTPSQAMEMTIKYGKIDIINLLLREDAVPEFGTMGCTDENEEARREIEFMIHRNIKPDNGEVFKILRNFIFNENARCRSYEHGIHNLELVARITTQNTVLPLQLLYEVIVNDDIETFERLIEHFATTFDFEKDDGTIIRYALKKCEFKVVHTILSEQHVDNLSPNEMKQILRKLIPAATLTLHG